MAMSLQTRARLRLRERPPHEMSGLIRRIRRTNKKAAKYQFSATLQDLLIVAADPNVHPKAVVVSLQHRRRCVTSKERTWETSFSKPNQTLIVWPEQTPDSIDVITTLYKGTNDEAYEDKEWTVVVDEITAKNRRKPIAAVSINMRLFIHESPGVRSQLKLKLRTLSPHIAAASITLTLSASLLAEGFRDDLSTTSSLSARPSREQSVVDPIDEEADGFKGDPIAQAEIARISDEIRSKAWDEQNEDGDAKTPLAKDGGGVVRPPWRSPGQSPPPPPEKRDPLLVQMDKIPTREFFEVDAESRPVAVDGPLPIFPRLQDATPIVVVPRDRSPRPSDVPGLPLLPPPTKIADESLREWCTRVAGQYKGVRIVDMSKSFSSGLALCALIHAYRPDLIGDYMKLEISNTTSGRKANLEKALSAASKVGVNQVPDASHFITPDKAEITLLLERLRRLLEGSTELPTPIGVSDHRISRHYNVNDSERGVIAAVNSLIDSSVTHTPTVYSGVTEEDSVKARTLEREGRRREENATSSSVTSTATITLSSPTKANAPEKASIPFTAPPPPREAHDPFASSSAEEETTDGRAQRNGERPVDGAPLAGADGDDEEDEDGEMRPMTMVTPTLPRKASSSSQAHRDDLRKRAREMLDNVKAAGAREGGNSTPPPSSDGPSSDVRRNTVRALIEDARSDGATYVIGHARASSSPISRNGEGATNGTSNLRKAPSRTSLGGSATDLRRVELVQPAVTIQKFRMRDPSPVLTRKTYDNGERPLISAISREELMQTATRSVNDAALTAAVSFDKLKRFGSMRSEELKDTIAKFAQQYSTTPSAASPSTSAERQPSSEAIFATPTRKVVSQWEKDVEDEGSTMREQETIAEELVRISRELGAAEDAVRQQAPGSEAEQRLFGVLTRLAGEKNFLVEKQEYYNIIDKLRETNARFAGFKEQLDDVVTNSPFDKTTAEKERTDGLMKAYMNVIDEKNDLMQALFAQEDKLNKQGEFEEEVNSTLERHATAQFIRGEPVSASRRMVQGMKNWLNSS